MAARSARAAEPADLFDHAARLPELIVAFGLEAMNFVVQSKVEETVRQWLGRANLDPDDTNGDAVLAEALMFALELAAFTPGLSGSTAVDRLLRQHRNAGPDELAALAALKEASFRLLRIKSIGRDGLALVEDLATGKALSMRDRDLPPRAAGLALATRLCPLPGGVFVSLGPLTPLDDAALEVALGFVRPGSGLANPQRCAAALYRHVVRHGAPRIPGINSFPELEDAASPLDPEESELDLLACAWARLASGVEPDPDGPHRGAQFDLPPKPIEALASSVEARRDGRIRLADAYARLAACPEHGACPRRPITP